MEVEIFDVDRGFSALASAEGHGVSLIGCGQSLRDGFRPSALLAERGVRSLRQLVVNTLDEGYVADFAAVYQGFEVAALGCNRSLLPHALDGVAAGPVGGPALAHFLDVMRRAPLPRATALDFPGLEEQTFALSYSERAGLGDLSLVLFLSCRDVHLVFPGDLSTDGWRRHLLNPAFRDALARVNLFVASRGGHASGYAAEVFDICRPRAIVVVDGPSPGADQVDYAAHAQGLYMDQGERLVLATSRDGPLRVVRSRYGSAVVYTRHDSGLL